VFYVPVNTESVIWETVFFTFTGQKTQPTIFESTKRNASKDESNNEKVTTRYLIKISTTSPLVYTIIWGK